MEACKKLVDLYDKERRDIDVQSPIVLECLETINEQAKKDFYPQIDWKKISRLVTEVIVYDGIDKGFVFYKLPPDKLKLFRDALSRVTVSRGLVIWKGGRLTVLKLSNGKTQELLWSFYGGFFVLPDYRNGAISFSENDIDSMNVLEKEME